MNDDQGRRWTFAPFPSSWTNRHIIRKADPKRFRFVQSLTSLHFTLFTSHGLLEECTVSASHAISLDTLDGRSSIGIIVQRHESSCSSLRSRHGFGRRSRSGRNSRWTKIRPTFGWIFWWQDFISFNQSSNSPPYSAGQSWFGINELSRRSKVYLYLLKAA
jgi:hypothetical protein